MALRKFEHKVLSNTPGFVTQCNMVRSGGLQDQHRVLYIAHGVAGFECFKLLLDQLKVSSSEILLFTYESPQNAALIDLAIQRGVEHSLGSIKTPQSFAKIEKFRPDIVVSMHARELIPGRVLQLARLGGMNLHPSLLPRYRGCLSGVWAIINEEPETGITYHYMNEKFDDGNLILQARVQIDPEETGYTLFNKLVSLAIQYFCEAFELIASGSFEGAKQVGEPSYYPRKEPYGGLIDTGWSEPKIRAFIRALKFPGFAGARIVTKRGAVEVDSFENYLQILGSESSK